MGGPTASIRVLLVDDEPEFLLATSRMLGRRGLCVCTCEDGQSAIDRLHRGEIDVVVLDVRMPGVDGVEVFRTIKRCWPGLPVVMLTGHLTNELAAEAAREGVYEFVAKPCNVTRLMDVIARAARRERSATPATPASVLSTLRVLLVDDERQSLEACCCDLRLGGVKIVVARGPEQATEDLARLAFDAVVWDAEGHPDWGEGIARLARELQPSAALVTLMQDVDAPPWGQALWAAGIARQAKPLVEDRLMLRIQEASRQRQSTQAGDAGKNGLD